MTEKDASRTSLAATAADRLIAKAKLLSGYDTLPKDWLEFGAAALREGAEVCYRHEVVMQKQAKLIIDRDDPLWDELIAKSEGCLMCGNLISALADELEGKE